MGECYYRWCEHHDKEEPLCILEGCVVSDITMKQFEKKLQIERKIEKILWDLQLKKEWKNTKEDLYEFSNLFKKEVMSLVKPFDIFKDITIDVEKRTIYANYYLDDELDKLIIDNIILQ